MILHWLLFIGLVLLLLALDLGVFHRKSHVVGFKEALGWSALWITIGLAFSGVVWFGYEAHWHGLGTAVDPVDGRPLDGHQAALKYLTGYVVEKVAERGQHLRDRDDLRLVRGAGAVTSTGCCSGGSSGRW